MSDIDLKSISRDELIKMWETANSEDSKKEMTNLEKFDGLVNWLRDNDFNSELLNSLAKEIASSMIHAIVYGMDENVYDSEKDEYFEVNIPVDKNEPCVSVIFKWAFDCLTTDNELLKEYGITNKKATKSCPYLFSDINWSVFCNEEFLD